MTRAQAVLIGGVFSGVLSALPLIELGNCCCLWVMGGGYIAAWLLQREHDGALGLGDGALVGLLAGVVGAVVFAVASIPVQMLMGSMGSFEVGELDVPPEMREFIEAFSSSVTVRVLVGFVTMFIASVIFSTLGGLLGAWISRKSPEDREPPDQWGNPDEIVPPPPPSSY